MDDDPEEESSPNLPLWFALRGPRPGWLWGWWGLVLRATGTLVVLANTLALVAVESETYRDWINAIVAWLAIWLQGAGPFVRRVARWRAQVRAEHAAEQE